MSVGFESGTEAGQARAPARAPLLALMATVLVSITGFGVFIPVAPFFGLHLGASATEITLALGAYSVGQLIAAPVWGRLSDRFGRRPILILTLSLIALSYVAVAFAETIAAVGLWRFFAGLAAGNIAIAFAAAADLSEGEGRARTMGLIGAAFGLGFILGPAIGGFIAGADPNHEDFARVCLMSAALCAAAAILAALVFKETRPARAAHAPVGQKLQLRARPVLLALVGAYFLIIWAQALMENAFGIWSFAQLGWGPPELGLLFAGLGLVTAGLQGGAAGALAKRFSARALIAFGGVCYALGFAGVALAGSAPGVIAAMLALAIGAGVMSPQLLTTISNEAAAQERGAVMGAQQSAGSLGRALGPAGAGPLYDSVSPGAPFLASAALSVMAIGAALWAFRKAGGRGASSGRP